MVRKSAMLQGWSNLDITMAPKTFAVKGEALDRLLSKTSTLADLVGGSAPGKYSLIGYW